MIPVEEARTAVLAACRPLPVETLALGDALGLVTAEPVVAPEPVPPFDNTAMDGYAVRSADTAAAPVRLRVAGTLAAGSAPEVVVGAGEAVRIMTGAPMPPGADAVVMVEYTEAAGDKVEVHHAALPGDHVRRAGEDLPAGEEVFPAGTVLRPGHLGVIASTGRAAIAVRRRARVGVLSTGDELADPGAPLAPGRIRDSNRPTLLALLRQSGCEAVDLGRCGDSEDAIRTALKAAVERCDAVLTSGGVSVGDFDYVKVVLEELAAGTARWMQVAVRPAKPLAFGVVERAGAGVPVFGLPGNPVSSMVSFELFARPALLAMMGHTVLDRPRVEAVADEPLARRPDGKLHLVRVVVDYAGSRHHARSAGGQGSHMLRAMATANGLALLADGTGVEQGGSVEVMLLS
ncbi:MAG TPA: gephyrin-like molybdotransferase Glp [Acidimicrobiales bacterium]|nr:gephyrin-like molybdotransferase Glp [Acidimicrobiales bacterium]